MINVYLLLDYTVGIGCFRLPAQRLAAGILRGLGRPLP